MVLFVTMTQLQIVITSLMRMVISVRAYTRKYMTSAGYKYQVRNIYQLNPQKRRLRVLDENFSMDGNRTNYDT